MTRPRPTEAERERAAVIGRELGLTTAGDAIIASAFAAARLGAPVVAGADMTRPYPVSRMIRDMLHTDGKIECPQEPPEYKHTEQCDRLHDSILHLMHRYGLPPGPPVVHPKDRLTRS